jgi:hypothetical protein
VSIDPSRGTGLFFPDALLEFVADFVWLKALRFFFGIIRNSESPPFSLFCLKSSEPIPHQSPSDKAKAHNP